MPLERDQYEGDVTGRITIVDQHAVQPFQHAPVIVGQGQQRAQGVADAAGEHGGLQPLAGHVPEDHQRLASRAGDGVHVVEVTPDPLGRSRRPVERRQLHPLQPWRRRWQQLGHEDLGDGHLLGVEAGGRDRRPGQCGEQPHERLLTGREPGRASVAQQHQRAHGQPVAGQRGHRHGPLAGQGGHRFGPLLAGPVGEQPGGQLGRVDPVDGLRRKGLQGLREPRRRPRVGAHALAPHAAVRLVPGEQLFTAGQRQHDQRGVGQVPDGQPGDGVQATIEVQRRQQLVRGLHHARAPLPLGRSRRDLRPLLGDVHEPPDDVVAVGVDGVGLEGAPADLALDRARPVVGPVVGPAVGAGEPVGCGPWHPLTVRRAGEQQPGSLVRLRDDTRGVDRQHGVRRVLPHHPAPALPPTNLGSRHITGG